MVRQRSRKSVEELYTSKFEANTIKSQVSNNMAKNSRDRGEYGNYIITNTPYNANCQLTSGNAAVLNGNNATIGASCLATSRRKSARPASSNMKSDKCFGKEEKVMKSDDAKKDHSSSVKAKTARPEKNSYVPSPAVYNVPNLYDNKNYVNFADSNRQKDVRIQEHSNHHHHHHANNHDDDKDDDTEEFFELIRQTVENAIGKSISDLLNRNFRELSAKVDRFSAELKSTNSLLKKLQSEINNIVHYGEENSRHFRYLCMKSEYDKMFYQHHTMIASSSGTQPSAAPTPSEVQPEKRDGGSKQSTSTNEGEKVQNACSCRNPIQTPPSAAEERSMSQKSSEMGMREVLEHIQRFCTQIQMNELKCDDQPLPKSNIFRLEDAMKMSKPAFEEDDDEFQISSDGMTPRSDEHLHHSKYGGTTMRSCNTTRGGNGGGDA